MVFDSSILVKSRQQIQSYLFNFGYLHAQVSDTFITKNKKTTITYNVQAGDPWKIGEVQLPGRHAPIDSIVRLYHKQSYLHRGERFDAVNLKNERDRIETLLRNNGYFTFNREYVTFEGDTVPAEKLVNLKIKLNPPADFPEHEQFRMNKVFIITDYSAESLSDSSKRDTSVYGNDYIIYRKKNYRKGILLDAVFFKRDSLFSKEDELRTINHLTQLGVFKFINLDYMRAPDRDSNYLDCVIQLTPGKRQAWGATADLDISDELLFGTQGSLNYTNRNLSKGADQFIVDGSGGVQVRFTKDGAKEKVQLMDINMTLGVTYLLNKFLIPFRKKIFSPNVNPKTRITLTYNFENRYDFDTSGHNNVVFLYQLHNFNATYGYEWNKNLFSHHLLNPLTIDFFLLPKTGGEFDARLDANPLLKSSYEEQIIIAPNYSYTYNNQRSVNDHNFTYFRTNVEAAGNVIDGLFKLASPHEPHDSAYLIINQPFSQYFRIDGDLHQHLAMTNHSEFDFRGFAGVGVAYGNSKEMPFVKQYYVGGPNSLRGFLVREIGPGSYNNPLESNIGIFDQTGDLKLETNAEIRFDIYRWLKGAVFTDAGNVWLLRPDAALPGGNFAINTFWKQFAVDAGAGLRLDFNYFVVRFDYGFPLRDPRRADGQQWQFDRHNPDFAFTNGQLQIAIGYPF